MDNWNGGRGQDSFCRAWGSSTKWKTGWPSSMRFGPVDFDPDQVIARQDMTFQRSHDSLNLNKPLPSLPEETKDRGDGLELGSASSSRTNSALLSRSSTNTSISTLGSVFRLGRRKGILPKWAKNGNPDRAESSKSKAMQPKNSPVPSVYLDKGTQTDGQICGHKEKWIDLIGLPPKLGASVKSSRSKSPLWSPKRFLSTTKPEDYFSQPLSGSKRRSLTDSSSLKSYSSSETQRRIPLDIKAIDPSEEHQSGLINSSEDSIGSYESRYSPHSLKEERRETDRPVIHRRANSDTRVPEIRKNVLDSVQSNVSCESSVKPKCPSAETSNSAPVQVMPIPFERFPSFAEYGRSAAQKRASRTANASSRRPSPKKEESSRSSLTMSSSLRQEYKFWEGPEEYPFREPSSTALEYFHVRREYMSFPPSPVIELDVPDHLPTSPLCPRHPKHPSGGTGVCPMHGQNPKRESSGEFPSDQRSNSTIRLEMPSGFRDGTSSMRQGVPDHDADDPMCPAKAYSRGACLYHEWRLNYDSDDSLPRIPIT